MKKIFWFLILTLVVVGLTGCGQKAAVKGDSAGDDNSGNNLLAGQQAECKINEKCQFDSAAAYEVAKNSICAKEGEVKENYSFNSTSQTFWFEMAVSGKPNCNPACVVGAVDGRVDINWRCTGLIIVPPKVK